MKERQPSLFMDKLPSCQVLISSKLQNLRTRLAKFKGERPKLALLSQLQLLDHLPAHCSNQFAIEECELIKKLKKNRIMGLAAIKKNRIMGLAAIEKSRVSQKSSITWLLRGGANTRYFQLMTNIRKQMNFIHALQTGTNLVSQQEKQEVVFNHFLHHIGTPSLGF
jgi:hypothetical protein